MAVFLFVSYGYVLKTIWAFESILVPVFGDTVKHLRPFVVALVAVSDRTKIFLKCINGDQTICNKID